MNLDPNLDLQERDGLGAPEMPIKKRREATPLEAASKGKLMGKYRTKNGLLALGILGGVFSIYAYSMLAVRQEKFLDEDFDKKS